METIFENVRTMWPALVYPWGITLLFTVWKPQRYFNSVLLMVSCICTLVFCCGLFGENTGYALLTCFLLGMVVLFLVPAMLIANGVQMLRKESLSFPHLLSLLLGLGVGAGEIATVAYVLGTVNYAQFRSVHAVMLWMSMTVFYFSCLVLNFVVYSVFIQLMPHVMRFDYVIIHGCGLAGGERITKLLANRVDKAIEIYTRCKKKPILIPSGGKGSDEKISEAEAMRRYLVEHGIPQEHILLEDRSATTMENLVNSKKLIDARPGGKRTALVSSSYHMYRCLSYARKAGLKCVGFGGKVAGYFWPSALIREFIAVFLTKKFLFWSLLCYALFILPVILIYLK